MAKNCKGCIHYRGFHTGDTERFCMYAYDQFELGNIGVVRGCPVENCDKKETVRQQKKRTFQLLKPKKPKGRPNKYADDIITSILRLSNNGKNQVQISRELDIPQTSISVILRRVLSG